MNQQGYQTQGTADGRYFRKNAGYLGNNSDLNDATVSGLYFVSSDNPATLENYPASYGYSVLANMLLANGRGIQLMMVDGNEPIYLRTSWNTHTWRAWRALLDNTNYTSYTVTKSGGGASGTWAIGISGNAATASKLQTARTISLTGDATGSTTFDGSANATITVSVSHADDADTLGGSAKTAFMRYVDNVSEDSDTLYSAIGIRSFSGCYPDSLPAGMRWYNYGESISFPVPNGMRFDLYANHHSSSSLSTYNRNGLMFRTGFHNNTINGWRMLLDEVNYNGYVKALDNLTHAVASDYVQVGSARLKYDSSTGALYVEKSDGTACGFYATGFVSAKGANDDDTPTEATVLTIADERDATIYPNTYGRGVWAFFRSNNADGLNDGGTYHTVLHIRQWANSNGGLSHQLAFTDNGGVWHRTALSETAWGEWSELSALSGLGDVQISSPTDGQALIYRDGVWKNETVNYGITMDVDWDDVKNKPAWIGSTKPSYSFSEITGTPSVTVSSSSSTNLSVNVEGASKSVTSLYATYLGGTTKQGLFTGMTYSGNKLSVTVGGTTKSVTINAGGGSSLANVSDDSSGIVVKATSGTVVSIVGQSKPFYIDSQSGQTVGLRFEGNAETGVGVNMEAFKPLSAAAGKLYLGTSAARWLTVYAVNSLNTSSDLRLKDVRAAIPLTVAQVAAAPSFLYRWKKGADTALHAGSSAQYWQQALPQAVTEGADGYLAMEYDRIALAAAIATARAVETLDQRVTRLEKENARLRRRLRQHKINV